jgi:hypothetical protein
MKVDCKLSTSRPWQALPMTGGGFSFGGQTIRQSANPPEADPPSADRLKIYFIIFLLIFLFGISTFSKENDLLNKKISLDFKNIDIIEALKFLSKKAGLNIIPTKKVSGRITLSVENASLKDVFDIMLRSNGLA